MPPPTVRRVADPPPEPGPVVVWYRRSPGMPWRPVSRCGLAVAERFVRLATGPGAWVVLPAGERPHGAC